MSLQTLFFVSSAALFAGYLVYAARRANPAVCQGRWKVPAALSFVFFAFTLFTVWKEGPFGFWAEHTRTFWSTQIWFDLLLSVAVAWWWMVPSARRVGMRLPLWLPCVLATGNVGLLAMLARLWWLEEKAAPAGKA